MKIYFLIFDIYGMGGTGRTVLNIANYLVNNNYDVEIISVFKHKKEAFFHIDPKIKITVLVNKTSKVNLKTMKGKFINLLMKSKSILIHPDDEAIHFFNKFSDIQIYRAIKSIKEGILITTRPSFNIFASKFVNKNVVVIGQEHLNFSIYPKRMKKSILKSYPKLNYLATLTDEDTQDYKRLLKDKKVKVIKLTNSIPKMNSTPSKLESKVILAAGRLVPQKGFDLLIESYKMIKDKYPDWKVKIFGAGRDKNLLQEKIIESGLYNHVLLMGPTTNIELELEDASIYALSSRFEGFGMVIVESMQSGVPVVSFDCPKGPGEIISHREDGILVENGNVKEFANALMELMEDKEKRKKYGKNAIKNVKRYEISNIGKEWIKILNEIEVKHNCNA